MPRLKVAVILCAIFFTSVSCDGINVDLSKYYTSGVATGFFTLTEDQLKIDIENINPGVGFLVLQVHTFEENVTLSETSKPVPMSSVTGTNIGLIWDEGASSAVFYILRNIKVAPTVTVYLVINIYDEYDPVPGGCNLTFNTPVAPYQQISYTDDYILAHSQPPSGYGTSCDSNSIQVDMYHLYLPEYDHTNTTYFDYIAKMTTVDGIRRNGRKVIDLEGHFKYGRMYSRYTGTGQVFAVIATYKNRSSAYVPAVSFGCDLLNWGTDCVGSVHWKVYCAILIFTGGFICCVGHIFFRTTLFLMAVKFGLIVTFALISMEPSYTVYEKSVTSFIVGACFGAFWIFSWWKLGIPLIAIHLAFLLNGLLVFSTICYAGLADVDMMKSDLNFWLILISFLVLVSTLSTTLGATGHIFSCAFIGSYCLTIALNYFIGGHLHYIAINTFRRIVVPNFGYAVIDPPFQCADIVFTVLWAVLTFLGFRIQLRLQCFKPHFPSNRCTIYPVDGHSESSPLLHPSNDESTNSPPSYESTYPNTSQSRYNRV